MAIDVLDVIPLSLFKQQIEFEEDDRDELITLYAQAAFDYCMRWCDEPAWKVAADIPAAVKGAVLLVFADMFEHRAAQSEVQLYENAAAERMMFIHRNWRGKAESEEGS
ncbi:head-tail connector protein [Escherichia coli]|uniref:head-tail connector protein n=1 Tax=Escherichia coli TaxID=562 RepID=UPI003CE5AE7E|nr:phage head-tail connector protein [Escherichia coli]